MPALRELAPGRLVSCHWAEEVRDGVLRPRSPEEALHAAAPVDPGPRPDRDDADPFLGQDEPLERR